MDLDIRTQLDPICLQIVQVSQFVLFFSIFRHDPVELKMGCSRAQNLQAMQRGSLAIGQTGQAFWVTFLLSIFGRQFLLSIFGWPFFWAFFVWRFLLSLFGWRLGDAFGWSLLCVISPCLPLWWPVVSLADNMFMNDHHYDDDNDKLIMIMIIMTMTMSMRMTLPPGEAKGRLWRRGVKRVQAGVLLLLSLLSCCVTCVTIMMIIIIIK